MNDANPIPNGPKIRPSTAASAPASAPSGASSTSGGVAFRALIEKLESQAQALEREAANVAGPEDLAGAVDRAHASLQDALSLSDRLLEAYRESVQRRASEPPAPGTGR